MKNIHIIIISLVLLITCAILVHATIEQRSELLSTNVYWFTNPELPNQSIGDSSSQVTMIVYLKPFDKTTKTFVFETLPYLEKTYSDRNALKIFIKPHVNRAEFKERKDIFINAQSLYCINHSTTTLQEWAKGITKSCLEEHQLAKDIFEVEWYGGIGVYPIIMIGIDGAQNTIFKGIPSKETINQTIREKEVLLGR